MMTIQERADEVANRLEFLYPGDAKSLCALHFDSPFELLAATILSAQCTDTRVNAVTPGLFAAFPSPDALADADLEILETLVRTTGFFRAKARNLIGMAQNLVDRFDGEVPTRMTTLITLPGVGRKTANVVRSVAFGLPGLPVDTHVGRISRRLGLSVAEDPVKVEDDLNALFDPSRRGAFSLQLILHGRAVCRSRKPQCQVCSLVDLCPSALPPASFG